MTDAVLPTRSPDAEARSAADEARDLQLQLLLLKRLARLSETRSKVDPDKHPRGRRMIDLALYSTYWDCVNVGRRDEARMILGRPEGDEPVRPLAA